VTWKGLGGKRKEEESRSPAVLIAMIKKANISESPEAWRDSGVEHMSWHKSVEGGREGVYVVTKGRRKKKALVQHPMLRVWD